MKYVVTGGAGFIGSAFVARLNAEGEEDILIVDDPGVEKQKNLATLRYAAYLDKGVFLDRVKSGTLPTGIQAIIHMGACSSTTEMNVEFLTQNNFRYTQILCEYAATHSIRFIYASSAATYGAGENGFSDADEVTPRLMPLNPYGHSKQQFDVWFLQKNNLRNTVGLKFFNVFGPNEYHKGEMRSVVHKAYQQIKSTGLVKLFKSHRPEFRDGEQKRDFIYVKDCSDVIWWLLKNPEVSGIYNLGSGKARSWKDLVQAIFAALGMSPKIEFIDMPAALRGQYQYFTEAKMEKLEGVGCPVRFHSLEEGVADYVRNYLETGRMFLP